MKAQTNRATTSKDSAPESEEQKFREKCKILKRRIHEVEESNELAALAISRTKIAIRRLRLEYGVLVERLEQNAVLFPDNVEEMSPPPSPILDGDRTTQGSAKKSTKSPSAASKARVRDPNLPKRPTNAYLIFCEREKERIKSTLEPGKTLSSIPDIGKRLIETWKGLDDEAKKPYYKLFEDDKERYQKDMVQYNQRKDVDGISGSAETEHTEEPLDPEPEHEREPEPVASSQVKEEASSEPL